MRDASVKAEDETTPEASDAGLRRRLLLERFRGRRVITGPEASDAGLRRRLRRYWWPTESVEPPTDYAEWKRQHDETGKTIFLALVSIVVFSLFCLLTLATRDEIALMNADKLLKLPLLNVEVTRGDFLLIGPILLAALSFYQHVFIGYQRTLGVFKEGRALPFIFNLPHRSNRLVSGFLFYWLVPLVLCVFSYRTTRLGVIGSVHTAMMAMVTAILVGLQIGRYPPVPRRGIGYRILWVIEGFLLLVIIAQAVLFPDPLLGIAKVKFFNDSVDLSSTRQKEELKGSDLRRIFLRDANLQGANFVDTNFAGANLQGAQLQRANLEGANLQGAILQRANLKGADLTGAINLTQEQIESAIRDETTKLPPYIGMRPEGRTLSDFEKKAETTIKKFISAYNTFFENMNVSNLDNLLAFWAKDAKLVYPTATLTGIQQIRDRYNQVREDKDWGDRKYMTGRQIVQGNVVAWEGTWKATSKPLNKTVEVPIVIMFELESLDPQVGITLERHFYDEASLQQKLQQLQLPRPR